uniref:Uncharacterized protein n=1 Tax=Nomascus leucogenys TaxID=61853 RepID=A0A2I3GCY3_NOMLE
MMWLLTSPGRNPVQEEPLPGCDVGKLQQPSVIGLSSYQARSNIPVGKRRTRNSRERIPKLVQSSL